MHRQDVGKGVTRKDARAHGRLVVQTCQQLQAPGQGAASKTLLSSSSVFFPHFPSPSLQGRVLYHFSSLWMNKNIDVQKFFL